MGQVRVSDEPERSRYDAVLVGEVTDDHAGELAGFAVYELVPGVIVFTHTEVFAAFEGHGVGGALARGALDDVRRRGGLRVEPRCPFIRAWIERHPDYQDLLAEA